MVDHLIGMVPTRFPRYPACKFESLFKLDQDGGRVPVKPLLLRRRALRLVRLPNTSRGPFSLGVAEICRTVRFLSADHERGMVLVLRLGRVPDLRSDNIFKLDQDEGRVPVKPLL